MTLNIDNTDIDIACPQCGKQLKEKLGRLKREKQITCPTCGRLAVDTDQIRRTEDAINKQLAKLGKAIKIKL